MQVLERKGDPWEDVKGTYGTTCKVPSYLDRLLISQGGDIDFTLDDESTVKAHSLFLAERSPLIKKILQSQGCNKEPISVPFAKELFKDFLKFAYTNQIPPMKDSSAAEKVVLLAQHFECSSLMHAAELQLTSLVDQPNVVELCKFAVSNQCSLLLEECAAFITSHPYDRSWIVLKDDPVVRAALCNTVQSDIFEIVHKKPSADVWTTLEGACGSTCTDPFLWKLLQSDTGELTFISKDDFAIKAHSVIVMERSPHLKAILETSNTDQEPIPVPFDKAVFSKLLQYIYTNQIPAMDSVDDTKAVLKIADHFQCYGLKHAAEIRLVSTMDTEDVINLGIFAVSHSCPLLLEECGAAIVESFEDLRNSPSWTDLTREPKLMESLSDPTEPRVCEIYENLAAANKLCSLDGTKESLLKELEENKN